MTILLILLVAYLMVGSYAVGSYYEKNEGIGFFLFLLLFGPFMIALFYFFGVKDDKDV